MDLIPRAGRVSGPSARWQQKDQRCWMRTSALLGRFPHGFWVKVEESQVVEGLSEQGDLFLASVFQERGLFLDDLWSWPAWQSRQVAGSSSEKFCVDRLRHCLA